LPAPHRLNANAIGLLRRFRLCEFELAIDLFANQNGHVDDAMPLLLTPQGIAEILILSTFMGRFFVYSVLTFSFDI